MKGRMIKEMMRMNTTEIKLEAKLVGDIQGFFLFLLSERIQMGRCGGHSPAG